MRPYRFRKRTAVAPRPAQPLEIHDPVRIAAVFRMFNRYLDGLGTALQALLAVGVDAGPVN